MYHGHIVSDFVKVNNIPCNSGIVIKETDPFVPDGIRNLTAIKCGRCSHLGLSFSWTLVLVCLSGMC